MQTPLATDASSIADQFKKDVRSLSQDAAKQVHDHVVEPAVSVAQGARHAVVEGVKHLQESVHDGIASTRKVLSDTAVQTQKTATVQRDRLAHWISGNPFAAVGIAMVAGAALASLSHHRHS